MPIPSVADFEDAKTDVDDLEAIVNGDTTVTTRLGGDKLSVSQALSQIIVGQVTVYSAATTYTAIEEWVEFSGAIYRPLPSQLPIGPEAFNASKWAVVQGAIADGIPNETSATALISSSAYGASPANTVVEVLGFLQSGDGGAAQWRKTGVTGLTASQTPAQLGDARLTDANGHEWELVPNYATAVPSASVNAVGAIGDNSTDNTLAVQALSNSGLAIVYGSGIYIQSAEISVVGNNRVIMGLGRDSEVRVNTGTFNVFNFSNGGSSVNAPRVRNLAIRHLGAGDRTGGAFIHFDDRPLDGIFENLDIRGAYIGLDLKAAGRCVVDTVFFNQSGRTTTQGLCAIRYTSDATYGGKPTDCHITNVQITSQTTLANPWTHGILVNAMDGLYISNSHFIDCTNLLRFEPANSANRDTLASVMVTNTYFDACGGSHLFFAGEAPVAYREFEFTGCQFRDSDGVASVYFLTSGSVSDITFNGGRIRDNQGDGIRDAEASNNVIDLKVNGTRFKNNNIANNSVAGDIITRGEAVQINAANFKSGGASGNAVRFLSGSQDCLLSSSDFVSSTCTTKYLDSGTDNTISEVKGFTVKNKGSATMLSGTNSITVNHGLDLTPDINDIQITLNSDATGVTRYFVDNVTSTQFDINANANTSVNADFTWWAEI